MSMKKKGINDYLNTFKDTIKVKDTYNISGLHAVVVSKSDLLKLIIESDEDAQDIHLAIDTSRSDSLFGEVSKKKLKTAIKLIESKATNGDIVDDYVAFNRIKKDINDIQINLRHKEWKKRERESRNK